MGEGGVIQTLRSGGGRAGFQNFFRLFGPQYGLKIRRGPGPGCVESHSVIRCIALCVLHIVGFSVPSIILADLLGNTRLLKGHGL